MENNIKTYIITWLILVTPIALIAEGYLHIRSNNYKTTETRLPIDVESCIEDIKIIMSEDYQGCEPEVINPLNSKKPFTDNAGYYIPEDWRYNK